MSGSIKWLEEIGTTEMPETLRTIKPMLQAFLLPLLLWLGEGVYDCLLKQSRGHELVRLQAVFDFSPAEESEPVVAA